MQWRYLPGVRVVLAENKAAPAETAAIIGGCVSKLARLSPWIRDQFRLVAAMPDSNSTVGPPDSSGTLFKQVETASMTYIDPAPRELVYSAGGRDLRQRADTGLPARTQRLPYSQELSPIYTMNDP